MRPVLTFYLATPQVTWGSFPLLLYSEHKGTLVRPFGSGAGGGIEDEEDGESMGKDFVAEPEQVAWNRVYVSRIIQG